MRTVHRLLALATVFLAVVAAPREAAAQSEGIKVHGDWTIDIREPDGRLAAHYEFKNALAGSGKGLLAALLAGTPSERRWSVVLGGAKCTEANTTCAVHTEDNTLTTTVESDNFVLSGQATASIAGAVNEVFTLLDLCSPLNGCDDSEVQCFLKGFFTSKAIPQPIQVLAGQIIQVKVVISFS